MPIRIKIGDLICGEVVVVMPSGLLIHYEGIENLGNLEIIEMESAPDCFPNNKTLPQTGEIICAVVISAPDGREQIRLSAAKYAYEKFGHEFPGGNHIGDE